MFTQHLGYIHALIAQGEGVQLDFKHSINEAKKIARSLSAFANTHGGRLLIGVRDNGSIAGVSSDEEMHMVETASILYCKPEVEFRIETWQVEGKTVVEVIIPKSHQSPHLAPNKSDDWRAYIRIADENKIANRVQTEVWRQDTSTKGALISYSEKETWLMNFLENHDFITLKRFSRDARISFRKAEQILINLIRFDLLKINYGEKFISYSLKENESEESIPPIT